MDYCSTPKRQALMFTSYFILYLDEDDTKNRTTNRVHVKGRNLAVGGTNRLKKYSEPSTSGVRRSISASVSGRNQLTFETPGEQCSR